MKRLIYPYGRTSSERLSTVHEDLQKVFLEVANHVNTSILCGVRGEDKQERAFLAGYSKAKYPFSMHNVTPDRPVAIAADAGPYIKKLRNVPWTDGIRAPMTMEEILEAHNKLMIWYEFAGIVKTVARTLGIPVRWGGNFKSIFDPAHWELYGEKYGNL